MVNLAPLVLEMLCLYWLIELFKLYERGVIFTLQNVRYIRRLGLAFLAGEILKPFVQAGTTFVLSMHKEISLMIGSDDINTLFTALIILLIGWVMTEGCKLSEEQTLTV